MLDQLIIEDKESLVDFDASLIESTTNPPKKKSIKDTVPFSNKTYDFSDINGEVYWEERELKYVFEITADSPEELEQKKIAFSSWVMSVKDAKIYDPYIEDYHFVGTFEEIDYSDEEHKEKTTVTVIFSAYPYKIANKPTTYLFPLAASGSINVTVLNRSSHRMAPAIKSTVGATITIGTSSYGISAGETFDESFKLSVGSNNLTIKNTETVSGNIELTFYDEVF